MAHRVLVELVDDMDGTSTADETLQFGLDGVTYEIDLSEENANELRDSLARFVEYARRSGGRKRPGGKRLAPAAPPTVNKEQNRAIREWARKNGFDVSDRGRIPTDVIESFQNSK